MNVREQQSITTLLFPGHGTFTKKVLVILSLPLSSVPHKKLTVYDDINRVAGMSYHFRVYTLTCGGYVSD